MKPRLLSKIGLWLFILAVAWYFTGNFLLNRIKKERLAQALSMHIAKQQFDIGNSGKLVIRTLDTDNNRGNIHVIFDPLLSQATVNNENLRQSITGQLVDGVFNITIDLDKRVSIDGYSNKDINIRLPASVNKLEFSGPNFAEISGSLPISATELTVELAGCNQQANMQNLTVSQLKLVTSCQNPSSQTCCTSSFRLNNEVRIDKLEVVMQQGSLDFLGNVIPQQTILNISDQVQVSAGRAFFQTARFNSKSPDS